MRFFLLVIFFLVIDARVTKRHPNKKQPITTTTPEPIEKENEHICPADTFATKSGCSTDSDCEQSGRYSEFCTGQFCCRSTGFGINF